jgi:hypothetical protein
VWRNIPLSKVFSFSVSIEIGVILPTSTPDPARPILGDVRESARFADEVGRPGLGLVDRPRDRERAHP